MSNHKQGTLLDVRSVADLSQRTVSGGRPQKHLSSLKNARGYQVLEGDASKPLKVVICPMDTPSIWERLPGAGGMFAEVRP